MIIPLRQIGLKASALTLLLSLPFPATLPAQTAAPAKESAVKPAGAEIVQLDPFEVVASQQGTYRTTVSNSITRFNAELQQIPISTDIFTADFINDTASNTVEDMLAQYGTAAGLSNSSNAEGALNTQPGQINDIALTSRGLSLGVSRRNGLPIPRPYFTTTDSWDLDRVEVVRGPAGGTLFGYSGPGGSVSHVAKQATFKKTELSAKYKLDGYGSQSALFDANIGTERVAGRFVVYRNHQLYRAEFQEHKYTGLYGQLAFKLPLRSTLRVSNSWNKSARIGNSDTPNLLLNGTGITDPRQNTSLAYLLAAGKVGPINPDTGQPYPTGSSTEPNIRNGVILNGLLNWDNVGSWGDNRGDDTTNDLLHASLDTNWTPWFATSFDWSNLHVDNEIAPVGATVVAPSSWKVSSSGNPFDTWASSVAASAFRTGLNAYDTSILRASALLKNEFLGGKIRSQTSFGWDRNLASGGTQNRQYYKADANGNLIVGTPGAGNDGLGRAALGAVFWSVANGPTNNPFLTRNTPSFVLNGQNYVLTTVNPTDPSFVTPTNPLGLSSIAKNPAAPTTVVNGINTLPGANRGGNEGYYFSNFSSWFNDRFSTLLNYRHSEVFDQRPNSTFTGYVNRDVSFDSYSGGVSYEIRPGLNAYVNYGRNFFPSFSVTTTSGSTGDAYGNLPAPAFSSEGEEVGVKWLSKNNRYQATVSYSLTNAEKETLSIPGTGAAIINPAGLNGRYSVDGATPSQATPVNYRSSTWELMLGADITPNWRVRLVGSVSEGIYKETIAYPIVWNDGFHYNKSTGGVTYSDGTPFLVPTLANTNGLTALKNLAAVTATTSLTINPTTINGSGPTQQLTVAMMSDPTSPYYAYATNAGVPGPLPVSGGVVFASPVAKALKYFSLPGSAASALVGQAAGTGLPISAIPYTYSDPAAFKGAYTMVKQGDTIPGYAKYQLNLNTHYAFPNGFLKGFSVGGNVSLQFDRVTFYYFETDPLTSTVTRSAFSAPLVTPNFNLVLGYNKKFKKVTFHSQLNIKNIFNNTEIGITPNSGTGFRNEADLNAAIFGVQREFIWSNTISF